MARLSLVCALALAACSSKKKEEPAERSRDAAAKTATASDAAPGGKELDNAAGPPVAALGKTDAKAAAEIAASYEAVRGLFARTADDEVKLSEKQRRALAALAGKDGLGRVESRAGDAGWGEAATQVWLEHLAAQARDDLFSIVRIPLWQCVGWGSATPSEWVAAGCFNAAVLFVHPVGDTALLDACDRCSALADDKIDDCRDRRCFFAVEGYFTGATHETRGNPPGEPGPIAHEFHIQKARVDKQTRATLRLPGGHGPADGPAITSGPKWGVMYADAFATGDDPAARAAAEADRLKAAGFDAEVMDSRRIPNLWCCSQAVMIGRFDTKDAATTKAAEVVKAKLPRPIVREIY